MGSVNDHNPTRLAFALKTQERFVKQRKLFIEGPGYINWSCVKFGDYCYVKPGSVIGSKGFSWGFLPDNTPEVIVHTGSVIIGNYVEIGALCTICRGTVDATILEDYVKLDDHIHIAHNCKIGTKSCIAGGAILGGGVIVGEAVWIGLNATIKEKVIIGDRAVIGMGANVIHDVPPLAIVAGNPAKILGYRDK